MCKLHGEWHASERIDTNTRALVSRACYGDVTGCGPTVVIDQSNLVVTHHPGYLSEMHVMARGGVYTYILSTVSIRDSEDSLCGLKLTS